MYPNNNCNDCPPCPGTITPLPLPDLSEICGDQYNAACIIYTGVNIDCLGIVTGMTFLEILNIFSVAISTCDCCEKIPQDCVLSAWTPWTDCECYYEDDTLICGKQTRTRTVILPALNGGAPCGPLLETRDCNVEQLCFNFGSILCNSEPEATQILASPTGLYNNKPYYELSVCVDATLYVWYNTIDNLWYVSPTLGIIDPLYQTLDNGGKYIPITNNTEYWSYCETCNNFIISSESSVGCVNTKMCFTYTITLTDGLGVQTVLNYKAFVAPVSLGNLGYPVYSWRIITPGGSETYYITVQHEDTGGWTMYYKDNADITLVGSTLNVDTYTPLDTITTSWVANDPTVIQMITSITNGLCIQPPDVPCVVDCGPWSECIGGTRTRICTIITPPSGNVPACPPLVQTEQCSVPFCFPPSNVIVTENNTNVIVSFTGVSGAANYTVSYTVNEGSVLNVTGLSSPILLPHVCGATFEGTIVTNCTNGLTSSTVPFTFETRDAALIYNNELFNEFTQRIFAHSFNPDGSVVYISVHNGDYIRAYDLVNNWDISSVDSSSFVESLNFSVPGYNIDRIEGHYFGPFGTTLFVCGSNASIGLGLVIKCTLSVAWDVSTVVFNYANVFNPGVGIYPQYIDFSPDGSFMFITTATGSTTKRYSLSTPWIINTGVGGSPQSVSNNLANGISFQDNGNYLFSLNSLVGGLRLTKQTLASPYNLVAPISTETVNLIDFITTGAFFDLTFKDGYKGFISNYSGGPYTENFIRAFELTCEYDISGPVIVNSI